MPNEILNSVNHAPDLLNSKLGAWIHQTIKIIPNIIVGMIFFSAFYAASLAVRHVVRKRLYKAHRNNLGEILGDFFYYLVLFIGLLISITTIVPSINVGDLFAGLGISSIAVGFAFKDILQNWLAGLLILFKQPFVIGDSIKVDTHEGTVVRIESRATIIKTYDSQKVVIPNSIIYTSALLVRTAYKKRRSQIEIGVAYSSDLNLAKSVILKTLDSIDTIEKDPRPEVFLLKFDDSSIVIRIRWWTNIRAGNDLMENNSKVISTLKPALDKASINIPFPTRAVITSASQEARSWNKETT